LRADAADCGESNPVETALADLNFADAMSKVALRMHSSPFVDETSTRCLWNPDVKLTTGVEMRDGTPARLTLV
jgi:hypothetical protein